MIDSSKMFVNIRACQLCAEVLHFEMDDGCYYHSHLLFAGISYVFYFVSKIRENT